jgi:hypothetical protein
MEVKIPISKERKKKSKLAEKQKKLDNSLKQVKVLKGKQRVFLFSNNAIIIFIIKILCLSRMPVS